VIGVGLGGAACAVNLVRRGWQVTLLDAGQGPAQAASALPVGMLSPHVTRVPTPLSRLCALGVADARAELERQLVPGRGWQPTEVDNLGHDPGRWPAALVRPSALVNAWLREAAASGRLASIWGTPVARLTCTAQGHWQAQGPDGQELAQAPVAVVAAAFGSRALLAAGPWTDPGTLPLRPVKGQLSLAPLDGPALAPRPMRHNGVFVPAYEDEGLPPAWPRRIWAMGSTYERGRDDAVVEPAAHERNADSLAQMHAGAAEQLRTAIGDGHLLGWAQVRCASQDRLPMVGAVPDLAALAALAGATGARRGRRPLTAVPRLPGLFMLAALGSRGLTLSHWCGAWLAGRLSGEASPLPEDQRDLEGAMDPARFAWKAARRQTP
jgi:tRNA 5-methylaminomethyl-2-thiouridine biosynthesis bifunctional protein